MTSTRGTLGTFAGVFTPSVLTILGIILFLRLGFVVGNAGLLSTLIIIGIATTVSVLTSISLAAIATNITVKGGGDYYLISRTLGTEFGGAIGIVLFLAQAVSIAFYAIGFGEALSGIAGWSAGWVPQAVAGAAVLLLFGFAWAGADIASRFQFVVMAFLIAALVSFFVGAFRSFDGEAMRSMATSGGGELGFWTLFAIFFPAVTGFTQGVSMSGDLRDSGRSLPRGTFAAVGLSTIVYVAVAVLLAGTVSERVLMDDPRAMRFPAAVGWLIDAGVIAATLSSAMASFLGAPRILQSLAADRVFPALRFFAAGHGPTGNPRRGVALSLVIALGTIALGNLNVIAPIVSMFFLISYGLLNYATWFEARADSPSFRPRFRWFDRRLSLLGALACLGAMLAISPAAGLAAAAVLFGLYQYLKRTAGPARWADGTRSYAFRQIREHLLAMGDEPEHPRDWRPLVLAFSKDDRRRAQLLRFASWIEGGSGLTTAVHILEGEGSGQARRRRRAEDNLHAALADQGLEAFPLVITAPDLRCGFDLLTQAYGIGPLRANLVLLNWHEEAPGRSSRRQVKAYGAHLTESFRLGCNVVVLKAGVKEGEALGEAPPAERRIDVWWWEDDSSELALLLAYLMTRTADWSGAAIQVVVARRGRQRVPITRFRQTLADYRIAAEPKVVEEDAPEHFVALSADAHLVFVPFRLKQHLPVDPFGRDPGELLEDLPVTALVLAAEDIVLDPEPDEGVGPAGEKEKTGPK